MSVKISIIIPIYNGADNIENCINSIYCQTLKEWEAICVDDGSTDGSHALLEELSRSEDRIIVVSQNNQGAGAARNNGLRIAQGEYISFLDVDDKYYDCDALEKMYSNGVKGGYNLVGSYRKVVSQGELLDVDMYRYSISELTTSRWVPIEEFQDDFNYQSFIFKRSFLVNNSITFPNYRRYQDPPFFLRALVDAGGFSLVPTFLYCYSDNLKNTVYSLESIVDLIHGVGDTLNIAISNSLDILYKRIINRTDGLFLNTILEHACPEIVQALIELNAINNENKNPIVLYTYKIMIDSICNMLYEVDLPEKIGEREVISFIEKYQNNLGNFESKESRDIYKLHTFDRAFYNTREIYRYIEREYDNNKVGPFKEFIELVNKNKEKQIDDIVIWGTAPYGVICTKIILNNNIRIAAICDNKIGVQGTVLNEIMIQDPMTVINKYKDAVIVITAIKEAVINQIKAELDSYGISNNQIVCAFVQDRVPKYNKEGIRLYGIDELIANQELILKNSPDIIIEMVMRSKDLIECPQYIKQLNPNYKIDLKLYSKDQFEPVIVAEI